MTMTDTYFVYEPVPALHFLNALYPNHNNNNNNTNHTSNTSSSTTATTTAPTTTIATTTASSTTTMTTTTTITSSTTTTTTTTTSSSYCLGVGSEAASSKSERNQLHCATTNNNRNNKKGIILSNYGMQQKQQKKLIDQALHFVVHTLYSPKSILHLVDQSCFLERVLLERQSPIMSNTATNGGQTEQTIGELYAVEKEIGRGTFGRVYLARNRKTLQKVAIKELSLQMAHNAGELSFVEDECRLLKQMATDFHDNIIQLFDIVLEEHNGQPTLYMVFEYCENGSLESTYEELVDGLSEEQAHSYFVQIVDALDHLHKKHHIAHRDLQLQNICVTNDKKIKICDFGLSTRFTPGKLTSNQYMGSAMYLSPEVHKREWYVGPELDVWSAGVCLYKMLTGYMPFRGADRIMTGSFTVPLEEEECLSEDCRDLLANIFHPDPTKRFTIAQIKNHRWYRAAGASQ